MRSSQALGVYSLRQVRLEGDKPTSKLDALVEAYETPSFEPLLLDVLKDTYPYVFALDLMNATPTMFADAFKATGAKEDVARKCRTFFLHAAKRAGVPLGPRILTGSVPRPSSNGGGGRRKPKQRNKEEGSEPPMPTGPAANGQKPLTQQDNSIVAQLLNKFPEFDPSWSDELKKQWFAGFEQFMKGAKGK